MNQDCTVLSVKEYPEMASGNNFCAHISLNGRQTTGFGKTKDEAIENAKRRASGFKMIKK